MQEAEEMHLKAIAIKERLLGKDDYEVALSVGHLASLYNYDMNRYDEAEKLYLRSIAIGEHADVLIIGLIIFILLFISLAIRWSYCCKL